MLAGAGGIDLVLFAVAADESIMPQSHEHLHICNLLKIKSGIIAITKVDLLISLDCFRKMKKEE
jgi:selenocysteine-specific elongation factor